MTKTEQRKWSVRVTVAGVDVTEWLTERSFSYRSTGNTLADQRGAGIGLARHLIKEGLGSDASVTIFKQLKDDAEPVRDRSYYVYRDQPTRRYPDGIRAEFMGA
jgi:hypothetical protein